MLKGTLIDVLEACQAVWAGRGKAPILLPRCHCSLALIAVVLVLLGRMWSVACGRRIARVTSCAPQSCLNSS